MPGTLSLSAASAPNAEDINSHRIDEPKNNSTGTRTEASMTAKLPSAGEEMAVARGRGATTPGAAAVSGATWPGSLVVKGSLLMENRLESLPTWKDGNQGVPAGLAPGDCGLGVGVAAAAGETVAAGAGGLISGAACAAGEAAGTAPLVLVCAGGAGG